MPLPELLATNRTRHPDPIRDFLGLVIPTVSLAAGVFGPGWPWWQRVLSFLGAMLFGTYPTLIFIGYWRLRRTRKSH